MRLSPTDSMGLDATRVGPARPSSARLGCSPFPSVSGHFGDTGTGATVSMSSPMACHSLLCYQIFSRLGNIVQHF